MVNADAKLARSDCAMGTKRSRACSLASDPTRFAGATRLALPPRGGDVVHGLELAPRVVESGAISPEVTGACGLVPTKGAHSEFRLGGPRSVISARGGADGPASPDAQRSCVRRRQRFDPVAPDLVAGAIQINIFDTFAIKPGAIDARKQHAAGTRAKGMTDV